MKMLWLGLLWLESATTLGAPAPKCPENEQYTFCSSSSCFEAVCNVAPTLFCTRDCIAGCQCMHGFARRGDSCIPLSECTGTSAIIWKSGGTDPEEMGVLRLQSHVGRCVGLSATNQIIMQDCDKTQDLQVFLAEGVIRDAATSSLCLTSNSSSQEVRAGDKLMFVPCLSVDNQKFQLNRDDGTIRVSSTDTLCLDNKYPSAMVSVEMCSGNDQQQWELADNGCIPSPTAPITDYGFQDDYRGWYDVEGCGSCRDYCRWVGQASRGDPSENLLFGTSHWSCGLAGSGREFTLPGYFTSWNFTKCSTIIPVDEIRRSVDAAQDIAIVPQTQLPEVPRSVPRKPRVFTFAPSPFKGGSALSDPLSTKPAVVFSSPAINTTTTTANNSSNITRSPNITRIASHVQLVSTSSAPPAYAIPLGVVSGLLVLGLCAFVCFRLRRHKKGEVPLTSSVPNETDALTAPPVMVIPVQTTPAPFVPTHTLAQTVEDPPPPYNMDEDLMEPGLTR